METRKDNETKGTVLARSLVQSFILGEIDAIKKAMSLNAHSLFLIYS